MWPFLRPLPFTAIGYISASTKFCTRRAAACLTLARHIFDPEDGDGFALRNVGEILPDYTAPHLRRVLHSHTCENVKFSLFIFN
jgi:hypothetical protein